MGSGNLYQFMMDPIQSVFFVLQIRRSELIQDTLNQLAAQTQNYKKPLKVKFIGEQGQDAGGVRKEFFQLIVKQIFDINYFMFVQVNNSQYLWFEKCPLECGLNFELIGIILGLSIYNGINLDIQFPIVIYKKLMNKEVGIEDLFEIEPELCQNLNKLKQYSNQQLIELDQNFQIVFQDRFDQNHIIDLKENGEQIQLNQENLQEYIDLYVNWYLNKSIQPQFESFYKGFHKVLTGKVKAIFTPQEIQNLINGSQFLDFYELEKITQYEGYNKDSIQIKYFWEIIHEFNYEQQKKFLFFSTGYIFIINRSDRAPIKGLQSIQFIISKHGENNQSLPTAHTCFNHILLPPYDSKEKMKQKLLLSIENSEGFGLM